ncbi:hypothetical protein CHUAL_010181 [Chamberlinius hualienensis]
MDLQTALVCLAVFLVSAVVVYLISVLGMRETTYEEAIAQQRRKDEETLQIKKTDKTTTKLDKKHKKWGRKSKEKSEIKDEERERRASASLVVRGKKDDPKSILIKKQKEKSPSVTRDEVKEEKEKEKESVTAKNVAKTPAEPVATAAVPAPAKKSTKEVKKEATVEAQAKETSPVAGDNKGAIKSRESSSEKDDEVGKSTKLKSKDVPVKKEEAVPVQSVNTSNVTSPAKKPKKSKSEEETLTGSRLTNIIKSSVLSPNEITSLIETLLNKQQAESGNEEWSKIGQKVDPITALRKQLQEKEEALGEEKLRSQTAGAKVKELRQEVNTEKARMTQLERSIKDRYQQELETAHSRLQKANNDVKALQIQLRQLQEKWNEKNVLAQQYLDETIQLTQTLGHTEKNLRLENDDLRGVLQENQSQMNNLSDKNEKLMIDNKRIQEHIKELEILNEDNKNVFNGQINTLTEQLSAVDKERLHLIQVLENEQVKQAETHKNMRAMIEELKQVKSNLEMQLVKNQQLDSVVDRLNEELTAAKEENELLTSQLSKGPEREEAEGQEEKELCENDKSNGHIQITENEDAIKISLTEHENILHEKEKLLNLITSDLKEKSNELHEIRNQLVVATEEVNRLAADAAQQKQKNNELREKNWKVVDALNAAEKSTNEKIRQADKLAHERLLEVQKGEQKFAQEIFERLFPDIRIEKAIAYPEWMSQFEKQALLSLENLNKSTEPSLDDELRNKYNSLEESYNKLQITVQNYKVILAETEGMLNKLQGSVEQEEQRWKEKLELKELELQKALEERRSLEISLEQVQAAEKAAAEMQEKLKELHEKLEAEENERRLLEKYRLEAENSASNFHTQLVLAEEYIEKLKQEKANDNESAKELSALKEDLDRVQQQLKDATSQVTKLNGQVKTGQDALRAEQYQVKSLQEQLNVYHNESKQTSATNGQATDGLDGTSPLEGVLGRK